MVHDNNINHDNKIKSHDKAFLVHDKIMIKWNIFLYQIPTVYSPCDELIWKIMITNKIHDKAFAVHDNKIQFMITK